MGTWGTAVFSDDTACDVRDSYIELVGDGLNGHEATKRLLHEWSKSLSDSDEAPVFWLALAATQWKNGRLEAEILRHALTVIDSGTDLARWGVDSRDYKKRQLVLARLRTQLTSPQPPEKRISRRFRDSNEWRVGDLVSYRLSSGRLIILRVIGHHTDKGGTAPICELLDWVGDKVPEDLQALPIRKSNKIGTITQIMIGRTRPKERPEDRLCFLDINLRPSQKPSQFTVVLWRWLDTMLKENFGIE